MRRYLEKSIRGFEIFSPFGELLREASDVGQSALKLVSIFDRFLREAENHYHALRIADLRGSRPGDWDFERMERSFPEFLAMDLLAHLKSHGGESL